MLHFVSQEPSYGNQLMERIGALTAGALAVNPNTMYPLLRSLEAEGHVAGEWEIRSAARAASTGSRSPAAASSSASPESCAAPRPHRRLIDAIRAEVL